ncbi:hypothetical protein B0H14DRAFT_2565632 [Mycena olivaceomarginata]|nr:hypothetical protein B0H14DRAFT_2565632 [Mycena olivaceomarginata]
MQSSQLRLPAKLGRLPNLIGEAAGGSLTADQWLNFITVVAPLAIPQLWQEYHSDEPAEVLVLRRAREISSALKAKKEAAAAARKSQSQPEPPTAPAVWNIQIRGKESGNQLRKSW